MTGMATLSTVGMQLAGYLAPAMEKIADVLGRVMGWLSQLDPAVLTIIGIIAGVLAVLSPLLIGVGKIAMAISSIMTLISTLGPAIAGFSAGALLPIIGIIAGVIAIGVLLYKNWDTIKEKAIELKDWVVEKWTALKDGVVNTVTNLVNTVKVLWMALKIGVETIINNIKTTVSNVFNGIKNTVTSIFNSIKSTATSVWEGIKTAIVSPIEKARDTIKGIIDKIKGFFSGMKLELPHIKLPHFSISGQLSLAPPSVPHLNIDWYKNGGIFTRPTIFPNGVGVGDVSGGEAVLPLKKLWEEMDKRFDSSVVINVNAPQGMDVNALALEIERRLIASQKRRREVWV